MKHKMNITCNGIVTSFEIRNVTPTFTIASVGIKDPDTGSTTFVDFNNRKNLKFGKEVMTLAEIKNQMISQNGESLNTSVSTFGKDFYDDKWIDKTGAIHNTTRKRIYIMRHFDNNKDIYGNTFDVLGIVDNMTEDADGNIKVKVGCIVDVWDKDLHKSVPSIRYISLKLADDWKIKQGGVWETSDEIPFDVGDEIHVKGDILYIPGKRDRYGDSIGEMLDGNFIKRVISVSEPENIDEYNELKHQSRRKTSAVQKNEQPKPEKSEDEIVEEMNNLENPFTDDDDDDLDFDF